MRYESLREAAEAWVQSFNAVPQGMIDKLMRSDYDDWHEITVPSVGDRVYAFGGKCEHEYGSIVCYSKKMEKYKVELDTGKKVWLEESDFEVERDDTLPMWGTMWSFGDSADDYFLEREEYDGKRIMSECGFRIYESDEFGYYFGIDGCGYSFYEAHWIPLYIKRGLHWHDESKLSDEEKKLIKRYGGKLYD